ELAALDAQGQAASATASAARAESAATSADATLTGVQQLHGEVAQAVADARQDVLASAAFVPIGAILDFPVNTVPVGFVVCAGQVVTRAAYPDLVTYLTGGTVALSATLPDLRGEFRRGADLGRGVDAGRAVGSFQADTLKAHTHAYSRFIASASLQRGAGSVNTGGYDTPETSATGDTETRPRNIAVVTCIKAYHAPGTAVPVDVAGVMGRLDAMAAVVSPNVGRFCTVYPNNSTQQSFPANATTVVSNNGAQASIGENWPGAGDGSLSIVIPEDGVYELTAVVALYSGAASSVAWGWITVNGVNVLESVDYCQMVIQDALQLRAVRQLTAGAVVRVTVRPSTLAAGGAAAANNLTVMRVR
ncbi:tail fiber protein, partial [Nitratidesulfovibrio liaohensis]|uniref:tail fiber protein n=1 Tax=Nitratidesulfovibrio liaohensis TaxID=2604158 RepID=UPI00141F9976